ncbi:MAG: hypothetical protein K2J13_01435, partial [Clostridia bacterium]|nr:hypothetical protein [Clostridia bacterium]
DMTVQAIRNINLADAIVSMLALQTAMMNSFGEGDQRGFEMTMNAVTGAVVCLVIFTLGIYMVVKSKRMIEALEEKSQTSEQSVEISDGNVEESDKEI